MPARIPPVNRVLAGIGIEIGADGVVAPANGFAGAGSVAIDGVEPVGSQEERGIWVVPACIEVQQAGIGLMPLADETAILAAAPGALRSRRWRQSTESLPERQGRGAMRLDAYRARMVVTSPK